MKRFTYFDFCQLVAGNRPSPVDLYLYDISNGWARLLSPAVQSVVGKKVRSEVNSELNFPPNFEGLVLGCIDADFCK